MNTESATERISNCTLAAVCMQSPVVRLIAEILTCSCHGFYTLLALSCLSAYRKPIQAFLL